MEWQTANKLLSFQELFGILTTTNGLSVDVLNGQIQVYDRPGSEAARPPPFAGVRLLSRLLVG